MSINRKAKKMFSTHGLNAEHFGKVINDLLQLWHYTHFAKNKGVDICNGFDVLFCIAGAMADVGCVTLQ